MKKLKIGLLACFAVSLAAFVTGCMSYGGSYEKHYHNDLSNGQKVNCGASGVPEAVVNGGETYEHHYSYDLNPLCWIGHSLGSMLDCGHADNEVVVTPCRQQVAAYYPQQPVVAAQPYVPSSSYIPQPQAPVQSCYSVLGYDQGGAAVYIAAGYPGWFWYGSGWHRDCPIMSGRPSMSRSSYYGESGGAYRNYQPQYRQETIYGGVRYNQDSSVKYMNYGGGRRY